MAMLRVGDAVYVDGVEMRVIGSTAPELPGAALHEPTSNGPGDPRVVLRGVGGQYHGRSFTPEQPRLVGRSSDADIRIDDPSFADRHARLDLVGDDRSEEHTSDLQSLTRISYSVSRLSNKY